MSSLTLILQSVAEGNPQAADELLPLIYAELRQLAAAKLARERPGQTLQPTALVHEAWLRLAEGEKQTWQNRQHFFAVAAESMRRILIDRARRRMTREKAGFAEPETDWESKLVQSAPTDEMLAIHEALDRLAVVEPLAAQLVKLRYFVGMTMDEAAEALGIPVRSTERMWVYAKAWLRAELGEQK
ncbi:MAG: polymerase subunit sigma [Verrucomicrobia bacterium]|nr:polymerase subunit sigma [Verrucomicrobiota bacterium]